jgi:hypothetical protein
VGQKVAIGEDRVQQAPAVGLLDQAAGERGDRRVFELFDLLVPALPAQGGALLAAHPGQPLRCGWKGQIVSHVP